MQLDRNEPSPDIRVLIVDDEYMVRSTLREEIGWERLGMKVVAEASNGRQALEKCAAYSPDLALIDISMPVMSGLEMIVSAKQDFPGLRFAILTAHPDFAYAQEALNAGALAYVLKTPVLVQDVERMLANCRDTIRAERESHLRVRFADQVLSRHAWDIRHALLLDLQRGSHIAESHWAYLFPYAKPGSAGGRDQAASASGALGAPSAQPSRLQVMYVTALHMKRLLARYPEADAPLVKYSLFQAVQEVAADCGGGTALPDATGGVYLIRTLPVSGSRTKSESDVQHIITRLNRFFANYYSADAVIGISSSRSSRESLRDMLHEAEAASELSFYMPGREAPYYAYEKKPAVRSSGAAWPKVEAELLAKWRQPHRADVPGCLQVLRHYAESDRPEPDKLRRQTLALLETSGVPLTRSDWNELTDNGTLNAWLDGLDKVLGRDTSPALISPAVPAMHEDIGKALDYMRSHLHDNLTLAKVAEHIHMNPSYFSHLFKVNTGTTFIDHLTGLRIERAKQLLQRPELKNYMLCDEIGFASYPHFCTQFKKHTGYTPSEYKQQVLASGTRDDGGK
ncbi:response regulator transcription factor [Paenibacillus oceani]|uniref:Response regulator n=1 Tax=Paenibacillus oceani TaxID=2772510 RepID=A0A927CFN5_9BACL|nr:response regulator [Paenibacillus oceani]MBD2865732.1 response regulator [Paenibacillus oceani]